MGGLLKSRAGIRYMGVINSPCKLLEILKRISQLNREIHHIEINLEETEEGWKLAD